MIVLSMDNVSFSYPGSTKRVLTGINAQFDMGKVYAIVGESGAGKTTLVSLIAGLTDCDGGKITYKGADIKSSDKDNYRSNEVGVVFQSYNLILTDTAVENVMLSLCLSGNKTKDKKRIAYDLLCKVGIDRETADRRILKLSGGEQQRVGIARALSHNPDLVIADEPTGNLDNDTEDGILHILTSLAREDGKCVIIVTHSKKVTSVADKVWGMKDGNMMLVKQ